MQRTLLITGFLAASLLSGAALAAPAYIEKAVSDPARPADDTKRDGGRLPAELTEFAGIKPGMKVVDLLPGGGYFTRIFAKAVGPTGQVYAYFGLQYDARLKTQGKDPDNQFTNLKATYPNRATSGCRSCRRCSTTTAITSSRSVTWWRGSPGSPSRRAS